MKNQLKSILMSALAIGALFLYSCDDDPVDPTPEPSVDIEIRNDGTLGNILVDEEGRTLYFFTKDTKGSSTCEGGCVDSWPIFYVASPELGTGLSSSDFSEITRGDGEKQTLYKGWPLYYFAPAGDGIIEDAGSTEGEGRGGVWFVAKPDYAIMYASAQLVGNDGKNYLDDYTEGDGETNYFVDGNGRTIYLFINDSKDTNTFTAEDLSNNDIWPIFFDDLGSIPSTLSQSDFGEITVFGERQLTYKGWPLYYFGQDAARGDNKGVSVPSPGVWPIVNAATEPAPESGLPEITEVNLRNDGELGDLLVDQDGVTLYFFANDTKGSSNCQGGCLDAWPIFYGEDLQIGDGLESSDFGEITRDDDSKQVTYKGWPLYYYSPSGNGEPESAGTTEGEGIGNVWFVAKPDYTIMYANAQLVGNDGINYKSDYTEGEESTPYFVDGSGRTIYLFTPDYFNINTFTAADFSNNSVWPIFYNDLGSVPSNIDINDFDEIDVFGEKQLTYKGWPLYYFGQDTERGDNKGVSVPSPGVWPIVNVNTERAPEKPNVKIETNATFGEILVDGEGRTLYFFTKDGDGQNNCEGGCTSSWPIYWNGGSVNLPNDSKLDPDDFAEIAINGGNMQTTYKGWPLYYYSPTADGVVEPAGEVNGDGAGTVWFVARENYGLMIADEQLVGNDGNNYLDDYSEGDGETKYFTDAAGRTLYLFTNDTKDDNNFTASDFSNDSVWPIFHVEIDELPSFMDKTEFGEIDVFGRKQTTYRGWPLYYFGQDTNRGDNKGVSVPSPGVWPIINQNTVDAP